MGLKAGEFLIKVEGNLAWECFWEMVAEVVLWLKMLYENLIQAPNYAKCAVPLVLNCLKIAKYVRGKVNGIDTSRSHSIFNITLDSLTA